MSNVRILERENTVVGIDDIQQHPANPNQGDENVLDGSLDTNGLYRSVVVQASTGYILAGNTTYRVAKSKGATEVPIERIDVTDEQAKRILLVDNNARRKAIFDDRLLLELTEELPDLDGTGLEPGDIGNLEQALTPPDLDDLAKEVGEPKPDDGWPTIHARVPHHIMAAWNSHLSAHDKNTARAMALLLDIDPSTIDDE